MADPLQAAIALFAKFEQTGDRGALDGGIALLDRTAARLPEGSPDLPPVLLAMGTAHRMRYPLTRNLGDLDRSLEALGAAFREQGRLGGDTFEYLDELSTTRGAYYVETGLREMIDQAIAGRASMRDRYRGERARELRVLHNLGMDFRHRFDREGDQEDLEQAGACFSEALGILAEDDPDRPRLLIALADVVGRRFDLVKSVDDLRDAVHLRTDALRRGVIRGPEEIDQMLTLAEELSALAAAADGPAALEQAIGLLDEVTRSPAVNPATVPRIRNNMAALILARYAKTNDLADLDDAAAELESALAALDDAARAQPASAADRPRFERALAGVLQERHARTRNPADLEQARRLEAASRRHGRS